MITVTAYDTDRAYCQTILDFSELEPIFASWPTVWVQVREPEKPEVLKLITEAFSIHHLALEDVLTKHQRAKIEQYGDIFFIIVHELASIDELASKGELNTKQLCFFLAKNYVVSFQFEELTSLNNISEKIINNNGTIRTHGADYLASAILDTVIDTYFPVLEGLGEKLEDLEDAILENPSRQIIAEIHMTKRQLLTARRTVWPMREVLNTLLRDASHNFSNEVRLHLRDCYDHTVELIDLIETYRELGADLMDVYLSSISNRMNEVMKVLTIIATVFAPPTLIAAIYGMNFNSAISPYNMPETNWYYGYPICLAVMFLTSCSVLAFLRWKGWLGVTPQRSGDRQRSN